MSRANVGRISNLSQTNVERTSYPSQVILPQENFWRCYCSNMELYIALAASIFVHVATFGVLLLIMLMLTVDAESLAPPVTDVIEIEGGGGTGGLFSLAPGVGPPIPAVKGSRVQTTKGKEAIGKQKDAKQKSQPKENLLEPVKPTPIEVFDPTKYKKTDDQSKIFEEIRKKARKQLALARQQVAKAMGVSAQQLATAGTVGGSPGSGGGYGGGRGKGIGGRSGRGKGTDPKGKLLTKSQRRERRWLINFSGSGIEHLKKLNALKVTLALPSNDKRLFRLVVLSGPRPRFQVDDLRKYSKQVKWFNQHPPSLKQLSRVLGILSVPRFVVIFLPEKMADEMAQLEVQYKGVPEDQIQFTWFEIRQNNDGSYAPVVVKQEVRK